MLSFLLPLTTAVAGLFFAKTAGTVVVTAVTLGTQKKNWELQRNMRLGINTEFDKYRTKKTIEELKKGILPPKDEEFEVFKFQPADLPESMGWLLGLTFFLTENELVRLFAMVRREMIDSGHGPYAITVQLLCEQYGMPYSEMQNKAVLLSGKMGYRDGATPLCYDELVWLSNNRLEDPFLKQKLEQKRRGNG